MADMTKLAQTAKRLIEKNGRSLILRKRATSQAVLDAAKPWRGNNESAPPVSGGHVDVPVKGIVLGYQDVAQTSDLVKRGQKRALVAQQSALDSGGAPIDLRDYNLLVDGGTIWQIVETDPLTPGDVCLLYQFHLKA